jgi:hypothetical protein
LKIEAAVNREGKIAAVRCRAAIDLGIDTVFEGTARDYRPQQAGKTASETAGTGGEKVAEDSTQHSGEH